MLNSVQDGLIENNHGECMREHSSWFKEDIILTKKKKEQNNNKNPPDFSKEEIRKQWGDKE